MAASITASVGEGGINRTYDVRTVQGLLNQVPSALGGPDPALVVDGLVGPLTIGAIKSFQSSYFGWPYPDGRVDPGGKTLGALLDIAQNLIWPGEYLPDIISSSTSPLTDLLRHGIGEVAANELRFFGSEVHATQPGEKDPATGRTCRQGYERLLEYCITAAPHPDRPDSTSWGDDNVKYLKTLGKLNPMKNWCGIFALWAVKTVLDPVGIPAGIWSTNKGLDLRYFATTSKPRKGDISYRVIMRETTEGPRPVHHYAVVYDVSANENGQTQVETIDGNSGLTSTITRNVNPIGKFNFFFEVKRPTP